MVKKAIGFGGSKVIKDFEEWCSALGCMSRCKSVQLYGETGKNKGTYWCCGNNHHQRDYLRKPRGWKKGEGLI